MKVCPRCGHLNPDNAYVCEKCGYYLGFESVPHIMPSTPITPPEKPLVKVCPVCGYINPGDAMKCQRCGYVFQQPQVIVCPRCGSENPINATHCLRCGYPFKQSVPQTIVQRRKFPTIPVLASVIIAYIMIIILVYLLG
ncbi:zinc-ribbon domain-containing protein [Acidianus infernus]|uniref:Zinc-ribbon domain-containing protein n=1 Tax=Acidianus infernus TaxID=12915 RepID=A0A6A9QEH5_ACIIN|nr:zinc-ribbon domain-containing protein [Acidianus infernus]MUM65682.1 zinc-ribbon domain-containing protein [Acidianus infernus]